jgi:hypothetical protein
VLHVDHAARAAVTAPPQRCLELLADVPAWPRWARLLAGVREVDGGYALRASILGLAVELTCALEVGPAAVTLRRLPEGAGDPETLLMRWTLGPVVELHVRADLDAPGPAALLRRRVERALVDDLLADFTRAL